MPKQIINDFDSARAALRVEQDHYANARGKKALAGMVVDAFVTIERIIADTTIEDQALLLSQFGVNMASGSTSAYSPWIASMWGEHDYGAPKILDLDEVEHPKWVPNASMAVYFHAMEELNARAYSATSNRDDMVQLLLDAGGAQAFANVRKKRLAEQARLRALPTIERQKELYLRAGPKQVLNLDPKLLRLPEKAGRFVSVLIERLDDGSFVFRGLAEKDASARLAKLAGASYEALKDKEEQSNLLSLAVERARQEGRTEALAEATQGVA